jgi:CRP-like cAMP-binding protein
MLTILEKTDLLQSVNIFREIRTQSLAQVAAVAREISFDPHQALFAEHEAAESMFVILEGKVTVSHNGIEDVSLGKFQVAGALAVLADQPHTETAAAALPVCALCISQQDLFDAMSEDFGITRGILRCLAKFR